MKLYNDTDRERIKNTKRNNIEKFYIFNLYNINQIHQIYKKLKKFVFFL
jgi:hypothetical protein